VLERVIAARARQSERGQQALNGRESASRFEALAKPTTAARQLLRRGMERHRLSGRAALRLLRVARTLADLAAAPCIEEAHVAEALAFRPAEGVL
jgi:magnesium chelatase family protein